MSDDSSFPPAPYIDINARRRFKRIGLVLLAIALVIVVIGATARMSRGSNLRERAGEAAIPVVSVVRPDGADQRDTLVLPGNFEAYNSAAIYARTTGYVRRWLADIGDEVRAGQTLAILDAPEVEQQLVQARADYRTALANRKLAKTTAERWQAMVARDAVSRQEADERNGDFEARAALADAALANVRRLEALQAFTRITAPFAGIVTSRSAQLGALVVSGNASAQPLFTISDVHRMRVYVRLPQNLAAQVHRGTQAEMVLPEHPGRSFQATVTRSAGAVDPRSGAVLVQLEADNPERLLMPGAYAQVRFDAAAPPGSFRLPGSAILYTNDGPAVAVVDTRGLVRIKPIRISRDEGRTTLVSGGVSSGDMVIDSPPDSIQTNDKVRIAGRSGTATRGG